MSSARIKDPWYEIKDDADNLHIVTCTGGCGELVRTSDLNECECNDCLVVAMVETSVVYGHADEDELSYAVECRKCKEPGSTTCSVEDREFEYDDGGETKSVDIHIPTWTCKECGHTFKECDDWYIVSTPIEYCTIEMAEEYLNGRKL